MRRPEELLDKCLVDCPEDIDLEVIAFQADLQVRDEPLLEGEASLVGYGRKGIITVAPGVSIERRRFSIAHEIGHWEQHRGQSFSCRIEERALDKAAKSKEREADDYASSLMMPTNLFKEAIASCRGGISLALISNLCATFEASFPATAIRYVELSGEPVVLVFQGAGSNRRWSCRSKYVPEHLWIKRELDSDTFAYDLLTASVSTKRHGKMPPEVWFDGIAEDRYDNLMEFSVRLQDGVYTLLHLTDEALLEERLSAKRAWLMRDE